MMMGTTVLVAVLSVTVLVAGQPAVVSDGNNVAIQADDVSITDIPSNGNRPSNSISLRDLASTVMALSSTVEALPDIYVSETDVANMLESAVTGAINDAVAQAGQRTELAVSRITAIETAISSLPQTIQAVSTLGVDVQYLLAHTANATSCASSGEIHSGNGECFDPVPTCPRPPNVTGGSVTLSADFIIPGVTATYACSGVNSFVAGPTVRTCMEDTQQFDGTQPRCLTCAVSGCSRCVTNPQTCAECAFGFDLSADRSSCDLRNIDVLMFGGQMDGSGHNHRLVQRLAPNAQQWVRYSPDPPISLSQGAGALIRGSIYLVGGGGHSSLNAAYVRRAGTNVWSSLSMQNGFNSRSPFYATVNEALYMFGLSRAAVYAPVTNPNGWTQLPLASTLGGRNFGATAVVGDLIYCLGGYSQSNRRVVDNVDIFNTTSRTWSVGTAMTAARQRFAAAAFDGKVYIMGGRNAANQLIPTVEEFNPATNRWTTKTPMPEAWEAMSTGVMPTYGNGQILIPFGYKRAGIGIQSSLMYDVRQDSWSQMSAPATKLGLYTVVQGVLP